MDGRTDSQTDGWTNRQTEGRTDAQMDGWTNRRTDGHRRQGKLGGEKENGGMKKKFHKKKDGRMNGWTDGRTDGQTDAQTDRRTDKWTDGRTDRIHCKKLKCLEEIKLSGTRF